jgi:nitrogen fixation protein FixH
VIKISEKAAIRSPWFIGWMVLLLVVIAMNVVMIMFSLDDNPGLVADNYYERGQLYDKQQNERMKNDPGWTSEFVPHGEIYVSAETNIEFQLRDKDSKTIGADEVTLFVYRPSNQGDDFNDNVKMTSTDGINYVAPVSFPLKGAWDLVVEIKKADEKRNFAKHLKVYQR